MEWIVGLIALIIFGCWGAIALATGNSGVDNEGLD